MEANLSFGDDLRLMLVIMRNEFLKQMRGKRLLIFGIIIALVLGGLTAAIVALDPDLGEDNDFCILFLGLYTLLVVIGATMFGATTVVSEFEERTALILFNRPIKKWSIYAGKYLAAFLILFAFTVVYYAYVSIASLILIGNVPAEVALSLLCCAFYIFGTLGVAMMFSALMKKSSTASVLTFFALFLLFDALVSIIAIVANIDDTWFMINTAASVTTDVLDPEFTGDIIRPILVMFVWGLIPGIIGFLRFNNRDF